MSEYRFEEHPGKDPSETVLVTFDLFDMCANFWTPNEQFSTSEYVRPNKATGFSYECTTAGTSAAREPQWPTEIGATKTDGSVTWTCRAAGANGVNAISSPSASSDPTGLTITNVSAAETTKIQATYSGGVEGETHDAVFTFTLNGVTRVARQKVPIEKR